MYYPGRICLLGEHCDWAGGSSLAVPMPLGVRAEAGRGDEGLEVRTSLDGSSLMGRWPAGGLVDREAGPLRFVPAAAAALVARRIGPPPARLQVESTLPAGRGFSSSAAFTLATLDALARLSGATLDPMDLAELAFHVEHDLLGVACGRLDQLACALGAGQAAVLLRWEGGLPVQTKRVEPGAPFQLVAGAFSEPRDTPGILAALNQHHAGQGVVEAVQGVRRALARFGALAETGAEAVAKGDALALGAAMNDAEQSYEEDLAAWLPALRAPGLMAATRLLRAHAALGAKFSGAGGDGSVIGLFASVEAADRGRRALEELGLAAWATPFGPADGALAPVVWSE